MMRSNEYMKKIFKLKFTKSNKKKIINIVLYKIKFNQNQNEV